MHEERSFSMSAIRVVTVANPGSGYLPRFQRSR